MVNIYVKNIPSEISNNDLKAFFEAFGEVESVEVITNIRTGEAKDYAFVVMKNEPEGEVAITTLNGQTWLGKVLQLQKARKQGGRKEIRRGGGSRPDFKKR